ncbi:phospholipase A1 [Paracidovorax citrulli]|nr:phospholipase A1 [Paracidovorax citrulli]QCX10371.1 Putative phospholipase A1 [Paracidovorax citrulli]REG71337.1 phospholipase A1 [Paracidovorax citrulli]RLJ95890.1 phospholipase A1 [Paracidovorax citrulli]SDL23646.1 phospholipase A1 [Paracidovorax citrulli]
MGSSEARLACFDQWAGQQAWRQAPAVATGDGAGAGKPAAAPAAENAPPPPVDTTLPATRVIDVAQVDGCRDGQYSTLSRFWELESGSDCGTFRFRGYRPISFSVVASDTVNRQPSSPAVDHTAASAVDYRTTETRIQLSVRTKIAQGLLTQGHPTLKDSLWVGYTQQSYWQLFSPDISRPFRATDHEPEVMYVYPTDARLPFGWRWRYSGVGLVHQSNGQNLPLSRSWNRVYLMTGLELDNRWTVNARVWKRLKESAGDDDNPDIIDYMGRGEMQLGWNYDRDNTLSLTARSAFGSTGRGSVRLEWLRAVGNDLGGIQSNLRFHTSLFSGYGDTITDYNRRRTVFSVGLSLVDF